MGILVQRWTSINFPLVVARAKLSEGAYIQFPDGAVDGSTLQKILSALAGGTSLTPEKVTTLQDNLNQLIPVFAALLLTFACMWLLKRKVSLSPISIIFVFFALGVLDHVTGII